MHIFPSVDIIVYDITRGSELLPGNKAYHQTSEGTLVKHTLSLSLSARGWFQQLALVARAARSSLHPVVTRAHHQPTARLLTRESNRGKYSFFMPNYSACFSLWDFFFFFSFSSRQMKTQDTFEYVIIFVYFKRYFQFFFIDRFEFNRGKFLILIC